MKRWNQVLEEWENGNHPKLPTNIKKPFLWRTSVINSKVNKKYKEEFLEDIRLESHTRQDLQTFKEHFKKNNKYAISFPNLSKDTVLVVPQPRQGKQFTNLYYFMKNASVVQQKELWKLVVKEVRKMLQKHENIWVSSQGLGIDYLHVRICSFPKYYENSKLKYV